MSRLRIIDSYDESTGGEEMIGSADSKRCDFVGFNIQRGSALSIRVGVTVPNLPSVRPCGRYSGMGGRKARLCGASLHVD
jgi:hypothetical protein